MTDAVAAFGVSEFRLVEFRTKAEYRQYVEEFGALRDNRWLYEQSLASQHSEIVIAGTCGLCLNQANFTAKTRGGETTPAGRVPNWREELVCD